MIKIIFLFYRYIKTFFKESAFLVRFIPTDKCNLDCKYCWQKKDDSREMTKENFKKYFDHARKLNVAIIDFLGGEPMLWPHLFYAISECKKYKIATHMTTNGTLLDKNSIENLGRAGLNYLNISADHLKNDSISSKNCVNNNQIISLLLDVGKKFHMKIRVNAVIYKGNIDQIKNLIEYLHKFQIPLSLGFATSLGKKNNLYEQIYFTKRDKDELQDIIKYILSCKKAGYKIIDPDSYFENIFKYLDGENFWKCNYPTKFGWINIAPNGNIRSCTKKMDELNINFLDLNSDEIKKLRKLYGEKIKECNHLCYSNCAYDSWYYANHKLNFAIDAIFKL